MQQQIETLVHHGGQIPKPQLNDQIFRLYEHNLCPFAQRAKFSLLLSGIPFQSYQMNLDEKADWHKQLGGLVPLLEMPSGDIIQESQIIMDLADDMSTDFKLYPQDPVEKAKMKMKIVQFNSHLSSLWPVFMTRLQNNEKMDQFIQTDMDWIESFIQNNINQSGYLSTTISMLDLVVFSVLEKMVLWGHTEWKDGYHYMNIDTKMKSAVQYVNQIRSQQKFQQCIANLKGFKQLCHEWRLLEEGKKQQLKSQYYYTPDQQEE